MFVLLSTLFFSYENSKVWADCGAEAAVQAFALVNYFWRMDSSRVYLGRFFKNLAWAVFNAVAASFALVFDQMDFGFWSYHFFFVKWRMFDSFWHVSFPPRLS
jgi:hypothetical protein